MVAVAVTAARSESPLSRAVVEPPAHRQRLEDRLRRRIFVATPHRELRRDREQERTVAAPRRALSAHRPPDRDCVHTRANTFGSRELRRKQMQRRPVRAIPDEKND